MATKHLKNIIVCDNEIKIIIDSSISQRYAYFKKTKALHFKNYYNFLNYEAIAIDYIKAVLTNE